MQAPRLFIYSPSMSALVILSERRGSNPANRATAYWENTGDVEEELYFGVVKPLSDVEGIEPIGVLAHGEH